MNNDIRGLIDSVNDGSTSAFMWEWFTTKPFVDAGQVRFVRHVMSLPLSCVRPYMHGYHAPNMNESGQIGSVPTPWPSWLIAAHPSPERTPSHELRAFLDILSTHVVAFNTPENRVAPNIAFINETFGYPAEDIRVKFIRRRDTFAGADSWPSRTLGVARHGRLPQRLFCHSREGHH